MQQLIVVNNPNKWPLHFEGVEVISAYSYLNDIKYRDLRYVKVYNLCRSYTYQSTGYYVSLLATARGHSPVPSIATIQDMKYLSILRVISDELDDIMQHSLKQIRSDDFTFSIYFGKNVAKRYDRLASKLFQRFHVPFIRAEFKKIHDKWKMQNINAISINEIPEHHYDFIVQTAHNFLSSHFRIEKRVDTRYDIAILHNPDEKHSPSNEAALKRFVKAGKKLGLGVWLIEKDDYNDLPHYDALFIRETTNVNHHTYRFSRRALAEGLIVIDDPESIEKCANKVFLAEMLTRYKIPHPKTLIVNKKNVDKIESELGFPCILKKPDSAFSLGVFKAKDHVSLKNHSDELLKQSDLFIAQEYIKTDYDWRVTILDKQILFVCKYFMARKHWQISKTTESGKIYEGSHETLAPQNAPEKVLKTALRAANLIGDGLYGVDLKQVGSKIYVIEVNDNPNIDHGVEDLVAKDELYDKVMSVFLKRIEKAREGRKYV